MQQRSGTIVTHQFCIVLLTVALPVHLALSFEAATQFICVNNTSFAGIKLLQQKVNVF